MVCAIKGSAHELRTKGACKGCKLESSVVAQEGCGLGVQEPGRDWLTVAADVEDSEKLRLLLPPRMPCVLQRPIGGSVVQGQGLEERIEQLVLTDRSHEIPAVFIDFCPQGPQGVFPFQKKQQS